MYLSKTTSCWSTHLSGHLLTAGLWSVFLYLSWCNTALLNWPIITFLFLKES